MKCEASSRLVAELKAGVFCGLFAFFASIAGAEPIRLIWDANEDPVGGYNLYYGPSSRNYTSVIDVGNTTSYELDLDITQQHYYFAVTAYDSAHTVESGYSNEVTTAPGLALDKSALHFNGTSNRQLVTDPQTARVTISGFGNANWTASSNRAWLSVSPTSGSGSGVLTVTVDRLTMPLGSWNGTITVSSGGAYNSPQVISVTGTIYSAGSTSPPVGFFDTPQNGTIGVTGAVAVTGWALDDIGIDRVQLWRDPVSGEGTSLIYVGDAVFVEGARPDVETAMPNYPFSYRAGWGYSLLTNFLPNQGNGTYVLHAFAHDREGNTTFLGSKSFTASNASGVKPFGTIDTPAQGGVASGPSYQNWGWVLTPQPNSIPLDGSTLDVFVDGVPIGNVTYGFPRSDIQSLFPGYQNTNTAVGYFLLDTTSYENGVHTIAWRAEDNVGNADGLGSRYFLVENTVTTSLDVLMGVDRDELFFGAVEGGTVVSPGAEVELIVPESLDWSARSESEFIRVSPREGKGSGTLEVEVTASGLPAGEHRGTLVVSSATAEAARRIEIHLKVYEESTTEAPFGRLDTPPDGTVGIEGVLGVTGWVLDDIGTSQVEIWREGWTGEPSENGLVFIGEAEFRWGERADVARLYPTHPLSGRAAWGYALHTRTLPMEGSGAYTLYAFAVDAEGHRVELGSTTVICTNPFVR